MKKIKVAFLIIILFSCFVFTGCWDRQELDEIFIVIAMSIDKVENSDEYELAIQIAKVSDSQGSISSGGGGGSGGGSNSIIIKERSKNAFESIEKIKYSSSRNLIFQHNQCLLISKEVAEDNFIEQLDFFVREEQIRLEMLVVIVEGKASEVLEIQPMQEKTSSKYIYSIINDLGKISKLYKVRLIDLLNNYLSKSNASAIPTIKLEKQGETERLLFTSLSFLKGEKVVDSIESKDAFGFILAGEKTSEGSLECETEKGIINFFIQEKKSKRKVEIDEENNVNIEFNIKAVLKIAEIIGFENEFFPDFMIQAKNIAEKEIEKLVRRAFSLLQEDAIDVYEIATYIYKKEPKKWEEIKQDWNEIFKNANLNVKVKAEIIATGQTVETVNMEKMKSEN